MAVLDEKVIRVQQTNLSIILELTLVSFALAEYVKQSFLGFDGT